MENVADEMRQFVLQAVIRSPLGGVLCVKLAYYWTWKSAANAVPSSCVCVALCAISPADRRANKNAFSRLGSPIEIDPTKNQAKASQPAAGGRGAFTAFLQFL